MTREPAVLVLTHPFDPTADYVVTELNERGVPVFRCDPSQFPQALRLAATLDGGWTGSFRLASRTLDLAEVGCAYYRRPTAFDFAAGMAKAERTWAGREARYGFGGVVATLPRWLNHPHAIALAEYKPIQLTTAVQCGLSTVPTMITNDPAQARAFTRDVGPVVYKPLSGAGIAEDGTHKLLYTNIVDADAIDDSVSLTAHLFQAWVPKAYEVRATVVDDTVFAARIDADSDAGKVDWRSDYHSLSYEAVELPDHVRTPLLTLMRRLDLRFGAVDFIVAEDSESWIFLEINPNGQWAWLQDALDFPIAAAIADALCKE